MWLLDVNLPAALTRLLQRYGVVCETAVRRGWGALTNGALAEAAWHAGFRVILTRDRQFAASAGVSTALSDMATVIVTLPQARETAYLAAFDAEWQRRPIQPVAGGVMTWP